MSGCLLVFCLFACCVSLGLFWRRGRWAKGSRREEEEKCKGRKKKMWTSDVFVGFGVVLIFLIITSSCKRAKSKIKMCEIVLLIAK